MMDQFIIVSYYVIYSMGEFCRPTVPLSLKCSYFRNPWVMLAVESVDGLSGFLPMVAGSYFCAEAAPIGMLASLNGLLAGAVFGAGDISYN